jgi:hypothetical protein
MKIVMRFLIGVSFVAISACGGSGGGGSGDADEGGKVLADNFDNGALSPGIWTESLGSGREIQNKRLVTTVTSIGTRETVRLHFKDDQKYMEATVRISSTSTISSGSRGRARLSGYFYNDRRGAGSGLPYNGFEGDVWGQVTVDLRDDGSLFPHAFLGPDDATGSTSIDTFLSQTFSTAVQLDTDYVVSIEQTVDNRFIFTFNGESFSYQEVRPMYPLSDEPVKQLTARIYAGGNGGTLRAEWDDVYIKSP